MKDMLDRLAKADPETMWKIDYYAPDNLDIRQYEHHGIEDRFTLDAIIQAVLQEAIQANGWGVHQMIFVKGRQKPYALITGNDFGIEHDGDSPVAALLAAYLSAIEEQA